MPIEEVEPYEARNGEYGPGMYRVGVDIPAGEYNVTAEDGMGYIQVDANSYGTFNSIITNDNFEANVYITISEGQYLTLTRARIK